MLKNCAIILLFLGFNFNAFAKIIDSNITTIYLFSGQGSDSNIFNNLSLKKPYNFINILYPIPPKNCSMKNYAQLISNQIDTTQTFIFIGVSLGGMICTELAEILKPQKIIIVSSAKCRDELPFRYRFQKHLPINKLIPKSVIKLGAKILQPLVEPDRNKYKKTFKKMLGSKNKTYLKRSINMIVNWDKKTYAENIFAIHGSNDKTLPIRNIKTKAIIKDGSHMMMLTRGEEISKIIDDYLE